MSRWQGEMEHKQGFLGRIVDIGAELFAMSAACVRAAARPATDGTAVELADAFCRQARVRVDELFDRLWTQHRRLDRHARPATCSPAGYTWLEEGVLDPSIEGPWIAQQGRTDGQRENVHRRIS